eukprot:TRINITY_DN16002_c0_g1_i1.p1 TRINITY_DN16002_c0_g1~~TRINITY_DN16002_c0_g1_i1.p1  ORF type:complete len:833 (-),score=196.55 TRINITY_DN16002_c0_g1_i1:114-2612(-)
MTEASPQKPDATAEEEVSEEVYIGSVKSYNDRRGFGFVACVETAAKYGRDVYMPKAEATLAAAEYSGMDIDLDTANAAAAAAALAEKAAAAAAAAAQAERAASGGILGDKVEGKQPPMPRLAEEDLVRFRVRRSVEGYPQAARVKKLRKFTGIVLKAPMPPSEGSTSSSEGAGVIASDELLEVHGFREVPVNPAECGQIRLAENDEVTFCVPAVAGPAGGAPSRAEPLEKAPDGAQAMMVMLSKTNRNGGSVLGCFILDLPRTGFGEGAPSRPNLPLDCHAFGDKLVLAGLPADLGEAELMRFFSKQGASNAIVAHAKSRSFASVSFPSTTEVARFLGRSAHAFADDKETRIAKLLPLDPAADTARLPALPAPSVHLGEDPGSLLIIWSPLVLAVAYSVELRVAGQEGTWCAVQADTNKLGTTGASAAGASGRFPSDSSSCKVLGLQINTPYEARVSYFTDCGTRSEASEASDFCMTSASPGPPPMTVQPPAPAPMPAPLYPGVASHDDYAAQAAAAAYAAPMGPPAAWPPPMMNPQDPYAYPPAASPMMPPPPVDSGYATATHPALTSWRSATGMIVPPPARPALKPADEFGFAVSVQWPAVAQAAAYVVELREAGSTAFERFVRSAPEAKLGTLVELRVGGLRPGPPPGRVYVAQVRTVAVDGSESAPSPPGWSPPLPSAPPTDGAATGSSTAPATSSATAGPAVSTGGSTLSADSAAFVPSAAAAAAAAAAQAQAQQAAAAAPPAGAPWQPWAPPPWLGQPPHAMAAPAGVADAAVAAAADGLVKSPWGAPGGPPPPPAAPPPPVHAAAQATEEPPADATGNEDCLILD